MTLKQVHAYFSGTVQGVGFRFTAVRLAEELGVAGFVRNLPDGRVELLAEAEEEILSDFIRKIRNGFLGRYIEGADIRWLEPTHEFQGFDIAY